MLLSFSRSTPPIRRRLIVGRALLSTAVNGLAGPSPALPPGFNLEAAQKVPCKGSEHHCRTTVDGAWGNSIPPGHRAQVAQLNTFKLPERTTGSLSDHALGKALVDAWRRDGIVQIAMSERQKQLWKEAKAASHRFFRRPQREKAACVDSQSYSGYIASVEEMTDGIADYSEIFTITKDLDPADPRVRARWPCHGSCP